MCRGRSTLAMRRLRWGSLTTKIIAWSFVPTAGILAAVSLVTFFAYQRATEALVIQRDRELTRLFAGQLANALSSYTDVLEETTRVPALRAGRADDQRDALRQSANRLAVFDGGAALVDTFGIVVTAQPADTESAGADWSDHPCYRAVLRARVVGSPLVAFSDVVDGDGSEPAEVCAAVPLLGDQDEFLGAVVGLLRLGEGAALCSGIAELRIGETGSTYLVDANGRAICHSGTLSVGVDFAGQPVVQRALEGPADAIRLQDLTGADSVAGFSSVPGTSWTLIIEESWASLTGAYLGYQRLLLLLVALGVGVPVAVVAFGVRQITRPIAELIDAAQEVASGHFGRTITAQSGDEIEELAKQFNLMSAKLQESYANLERRVADRTRELAALNAIALTVSQSLDLQETLEHALEMTTQVMGVDAGGIYLLDRDTGMLNVVAHRGLSRDLVSAIDALKLGEGFSGAVAQTGQPLVVADVSTDVRLTRPAVREEGVQSLVIAPLSTKGTVVGTIFAQARTQRTFTDQDVELLTSIGRQVALATENAQLFESEQRRAEQFRAISEVTSRVTAILAPDELLRQLVRLVHESFGYDTVEIGLIEGDELVFRAGVDRDLDVFEPFRIRVGDEGITGCVAATGQPILVPDVSLDPRYIMVTDANARSELAVPISVAGTTIGVLNVQSQALDAFDASDVSAIRSLADQAAIAIENARLFNAELRRAEQFRVISEMGRRITSILDIDRLLQEIVSLIRETFGYALITVGLIEGRDLVFKAGTKTNWPEPWFQPPPVAVGGQGITAWVAEHGEPLLVNDVASDPRYLVWPAAQETRSELAVPVRTMDAVIGVLNVESDVSGAFDESDLQVLQLLANQAAVAIDNARNYERAQQAAVLEERARLARELHDAVTQTLFSASLIAETLPALWESDEDEGRELLGTLRQLSRGALAEMRTLLMELRPSALAEASLDDLLTQLAEAVTGRTGIPVEVSVLGRCELPPVAHAALYRIAQEALNNVVKHAQAQSVTVTLTCPDPARDGRQAAVLQVCDDGRGFDPEGVPPESLGLDIMRERSDAIGAALSIVTELGCGTAVTVTWGEA